MRALEANARALSSAPQLASSSIMDGAVDQVVSVQTGVDSLGNPVFAEQVVSRYGQQSDGSNTVVVFDGPTPPRPVGFTVTGGPGYLAVEWFGEFEDRFEPYLDHDYVAVHVGGAPGFTPIADTLKASMRSRTGESVTVGGLAPGSYYVTLVAVSQAGVWGAAAPYTAGDPSEPSAVDVTARAAAAAAQATADQAVLDAAAAQSDADQALADAAAAAAAVDGKATTYIQADEPAGLGAADTGDLWFESDVTPWRPYTWSGSAWVVSGDKTARDAAAAAQTAAGTAQTTADTKIVTFYGPSEPAADGEGDLWIRSTDKRLHRWSGSAWVELKDQAIVDAQAAADAASAAANAAETAALAAQGDATSALTLAGTKSTVWYSTSAPTTEGVDGDMWWQRDAGTGAVQTVWEKRSGVWEQRTITSTVIDSITAGQITTGTIAAGVTVNVGAPTADPHIEIGDAALQVYRTNPEGELVPTIRVGGVLGDNLIIMDPATGATKAGFNSDGDGVAGALAVDSLTVGGVPIHTIAAQSSNKQVAGFRAAVTRPAITTTQYGLFEVAADLPGGRIYQVTFRGNFTHGTAGGAMRLFLRVTTDGSAPLTTSNQLSMGWFGHPVASLPYQHHLSTFFHVGNNPATVLTVRILVSAQTLAGTAAFYPDGGTTPGWFTIDDVGEYDEGFMLDGAASGGDAGTPPPPTPTKSYTKTLAASWTRVWQGGDIRTDTTDAVQGFNVWQNYAMIGFPTTLYSDLNGSTVQKIEVYLYAYHWYYGSGGTAVIGAHGSTTAPASFSYSGSVASTGWPRGAGRWVTLPSAWHAGFASGANRGITLGGGVSSSYIYYGRFFGSGASSQKPAIRYTYVK